MKTHMTRSLVPRLSALAIALSVMTGCSDTPESAAPEARTAYVASVRQATGDQRAYIGTVRATQRGQLSFPVSGKVSAVLVESGDVVRKGQVLARLDPVPFAAQEASAAGDVARAQAALDEVQRRVERLDVAQKADALSPAEMVAPERETPGTSATHCTTPTTSASRIVISRSPRTRLPSRVWLRRRLRGSHRYRPELVRPPARPRRRG